MAHSFSDAALSQDGAIPAAESRRPSAADRVYAALRDRIVSLDLVPGTNLARPAIAAEYGVSQTPVRDAFLRLDAEGLITVYPQSRTVVAPIDIDHARETQFLRIGVELEVTRCLAASGDPKALVTPRRILTLQRLALEEEDDLDRFSALDWHFHHALSDAVGYPDLWRMISRRSGHIDRLRNLNLPDPGKAKNILDLHTRILDAISAGDRAATEAAVREHLSGTLATVEQISAAHPGYF